MMRHIQTITLCLSQTRVPLAAAASLALLIGFGPGTTASAVDINPFETGRVADDNGDELGDNNTLAGGSALIVGDSSNNTSEFRSVFEFDISGDTAAINAAPATGGVTFSISISNKLNAAPDFDLIALAADEDGVVDNDDFQAAGTLVQSFSAADFEIDDTVMADVTSFVQADSAASQQFSSFRLQVSNPALFNNGNGNADAFFFGTNGSNDATLSVVIPEPASLALLGLGALAMVSRRRKA